MRKDMKRIANLFVAMRRAANRAPNVGNSEHRVFGEQDTRPRLGL